MAHLLGLAPITVEKLEYGTRVLSKPIAERYRAETGCDLNGSEVLASIDGAPFTRELFERHRTLKENRERDDDLNIRWSLFSIDLTLEASRKAGCLSEALQRLEMARLKVEDALQLEEETSNLVDTTDPNSISFSFTTRVELTEHLKRMLLGVPSANRADPENPLEKPQPD